MRFQVPQFIEVEDKIFGPFTFKQFVYLAGGGGASLVLYLWLPKIFSFPLIALVIGTACMLAFYKVNNKPFVFLVESFFKYMSNPRLYVWKKIPKTPKQVKEKEVVDTPNVPKLSDSKLKDLAWSLDIADSAQKKRNI